MPDLFKPEPAHVKVDILNSQRRTEMYHFKVMELRTYEDKLEKSDLKVRFHFLFDLIKKVKRPELEQFDWNVDSKPLQRLYLSKDTTKLMEVTNNFIGTVYKRKNLDSFGKSVVGGAKADKDSIDDGQQVKWIVYYHIKRFPKDLAMNTSVPFLFSPNFDLQFDFNYRSK